MPQAHNMKAAELHEAAAKSHRAAADLHGKNDDKAALDHCAKACSESDAAHKASANAHGKSAARGAMNSGDQARR